MFKNLKQSLSLNILAFAMYPIIGWLVTINKYLRPGGIVIDFTYYLIIGYYIVVICIAIAIYILEILFDKKVISPKILQNKIYNICFNIGLSFGILLMSFFVSTIIYSYIVD